MPTRLEAGLTPEEVLRVVTLNGAVVMSLDDRLGTVAEGKPADLVVPEADPLTSVTNLRAIRPVVERGRIWTPAELLDE